MKVFWDPDCLLHNPPYEILSGDKLPYFESPARLQLIKKELEGNPSLFSLKSASSSQNPGLDITRYIEMVHSREYLDYLRNAYDNWVQSGGSTVPLSLAICIRVGHQLVFLSSGRRVTRNVPAPEAAPGVKGDQRRLPFSRRPSRFVDQARSPYFRK